MNPNNAKPINLNAKAVSLPHQPSHILLLGGRAPACLQWARVLHQLGHQISVADSLSPYLTQFSNCISHHHILPPPAQQYEQWRQSLTALVIQHNISHIIATCEEVFYLAQACKQEPEIKKRAWVSDFNLLIKLHNKYQFHQFITSNNGLLDIQTPDSFLLSKQADVVHFLQHLQSCTTNQCDTPFNTPLDWVIKPCLSRFATKTLVRPTLSQLLSTLFNSPLPKDNSQRQQLCHHIINTLSKNSSIYCLTQHWIAQRHILGAEYASYTLAQAGKVIAHTSYQATCRSHNNNNQSNNNQSNSHQNHNKTPQTSHNLQTDKSHANIGASLDFDCVSLAKVEQFTQAFIEQTQFTGQVAFDFIKDKQGKFWVLECNPRATSGIHLLCSQPEFLSCLRQPNNPTFWQRHAPHLSLKLAVGHEMLKAYKIPRTAQRYWQTLQHSHDVIYQPDDLLPVLGQLVSVGNLLWLSWRHKRPLFELTTADIEWN